VEVVGGIGGVCGIRGASTIEERFLASLPAKRGAGEMTAFLYRDADGVYDFAQGGFGGFGFFL